MIDEKELERVCRLAGLMKITTAKVPTYRTKTGEAGLELTKDGLKAFWIDDNYPGFKNYEKIMDDLKICSVLQAFEAETLKYEPIIENGVKVGEKLKDENRGIVEDVQQHNKLVVGDVAALAGSYGIPAEMANLFFVKFDNKLYIKNPGLLWLGAKKGYGHMEVTDAFNEKTQEWEAEYKIYPVLTKEILDSISKLDVSIQEKALNKACEPTNGKGRAGKDNIKMNTMLKFARELAQTRAQNRALRAYTGYGGTSAEELDRGEV